MSFRTCIGKILVLMTFFALIGCSSSPSTTAVSSNSNGLVLDTAIEQAAGRIENAFESGTEIALVSVSSPSTQFSEYVLTYLETVLVNNGKLAVVDRSNLDRIREEQGFQLSGEVSDESAKAIGQLLGAGAIVTGGLVNLGDAYRINLKAINVETARIAASYAGDIVGSPRIQTLLASGGGASLDGTVTARTRQVTSTNTIQDTSATESPPMEPPPVPMNLKTSTITRTTVDMSWEAVRGENVSYCVYYGMSDNLAAAKLAGNTRMSSYRIENLQGGTKYFFWVSTVDTGVESPKSDSISAETSNTFQIGERGPSGGWIFYDKGVVSNGWRYMEAAPNDLGPAQWGASGTAVGGTNTSVGAGRANTQRIIPILNRVGQDGAALLCSEFSINGYTGWFLPSKDELNLMYTNLKEKHLGGFGSDWYWSSSEGGCDSSSGSHMSSPDDSAWTQNFKDGTQTNTNYEPWGGHGVKNNSYSVRAVRAF